MIVDDLLKNPGPWLSMHEGTGIVVSSRIRLARNIKGFHFPSRASPEESVKICGRLSRVFDRMSTTRDCLFLDMGTLDPVEKELLKERQVISRELAEKGKGSAVVIAGDERFAIMVNEEDHLRLQALCPGMDLDGIHKRIDAVDTELDQHIDYAFSPQLGYLTACPSNVGTGLRASVMMHLPGLRLLNEIERVVKGLERIGLAVRGLQGEGSDAVGDMFQVSNQTTLGETEKAIVADLVERIRELVEHEQNARWRLLEDRKTCLLDQIGRSYGVLLNAHVLTSHEAVDMLSALRLGVEFQMVQNLTVGRIHEIILLTQPGHLQKMAGRAMDPDERDEIRARFIRQELSDVCLVETGRKRRSSGRRRQVKKNV